MTIEEIAEKVWRMDWPTTVSLKTMAADEREAVEAAMERRYGRRVDLSGPSDKVREAVKAAWGNRRPFASLTLSSLTTTRWASNQWAARRDWASEKPVTGPFSALTWGNPHAPD